MENIKNVFATVNIDMEVTFSQSFFKTINC